jgi:hypothetical protein
MEESPPPLVGGSFPGNSSYFPTTPWAVMDMFFGIIYGSFGYLISKNRKGDCMSSILSFVPSFSGYAGVWDKPYKPSVKKMFYDLPMWFFHVWAVMKIAANCSGQYQFSVQNPWQQVFASKGEMNPYVIGEEARKRAAANVNLNKDNNYMQEQASSEKDIHTEAKPDAHKVWKGASADVEIDIEDDRPDDFTDKENF